MKANVLLMGALCLLAPITALFCQENTPVKFGKISPLDFTITGHKFDTSVNAVIISDVGNSSFEGNNKGWFTLMYKRHRRVKILNKNGFDAADVSVYLYNEGQGEELLNNLKASTYNLEDGQVVETKLDQKEVYKEKISEHVLRKKFTFPGVKAGAIIEYSYTIASDFLFNLQPWTFQDKYPCLWSEYEVGMPEFFNYVFLSQGYQPFFIKTNKENHKSYNILQSSSIGARSDHITINGRLMESRWVMKDVPAIQEESYTSSITNHYAKIEFQLSQYRFPDMPVKDIMGNWVTATEALLKDNDFGGTLGKDNNWLGDDLREITADCKTPFEKAQTIYAFVRDHFTCTQYSGLRLRNTLRAVFKNKNGTVAEINLLLVAMLRHEGIVTDPVILSTREHGFANEFYPLMERFNYVIASAVLENKVFYLDASRPLGFGKLSEECYNGVARVIGSEPAAVYFYADSLRESKLTSVFIAKNDKGGLDGRFTAAFGASESARLRKRVRTGGEDALFKTIRTTYGDDYQISDEKLDSLNKLEEPLALKYNFHFNHFKDDLIYFHPLLTEGYRENIFKAAQRNYPVEMPYQMNETFILNMEVPEHYEIDEMPKSARVNFNEDEGFFEYMIGKTSEGIIQLRSRIVLKKANFSPEDYDSLREFFGYIVKKHGEQIVFKKKS